MAQRSDLNSRVCQWIGQGDALRHFATYSGSTQSQQHIKPLHWYVACRLVLEGGFRPEEIGRLEWSPESPALAMENARSPGYEIQLAAG